MKKIVLISFYVLLASFVGFISVSTICLAGALEDLENAAPAAGEGPPVPTPVCVSGCGQISPQTEQPQTEQPQTEQPQTNPTIEGAPIMEDEK